MLVLPLLLVLVGLWMTRPRPMPTDAPRARPAEAPAVPAADEPAAAMAAAPLVLPARDPFQLPAAIAAARAALFPNEPSLTSPSPVRLQGIIWGIQPPRAIINDRIVKIGESIEGAQIVDIAPEGVTIDYQGQRTVVRLPAPSPSSPPAHDSSP